MTIQPPKNCRFCGAPLTDQMISGRTVICSKCHSTYEFAPAQEWFHSRRTRLTIISIVAFLAVMVIGRIAYLRAIGINTPFSKGEESKEVRETLKKCINSPDPNCLMEAFKELHEKNPDDVSLQANFAFSLTDLGKASEAQPIYEALSKRRVRTYDFSAYYARNLVALGKNEEAKNWYIQSLSKVSNLVDVTNEFATVLVSLGESCSAYSMLKSFIEQYPQSQNRLRAGFTMIQNNINEAGEKACVPLGKSSWQVYASNGAFYMIPVFLESAWEGFRIDNTTERFTLSTELFKKYLADKAESVVSAKHGVGMAKDIEGFSFKYPSLKVGNREVTSIEGFHCEKCPTILGKRIQAKLKTKSAGIGDLQILEVSD